MEIFKIAIGDREIVRVETVEDNYIHTNEDEEKAYQEIKDVFGVEAVKPTHWPEGTVFLAAEVDEKLQTAMFIYEYKGENINYFITSHFTESSWGVDVENKVTDQYYVELKKGLAEVYEYETPKLNEKMYSAKYTYNGLEYFLIGTIEKEDFEFLLINLKFFY